MSTPHLSPSRRSETSYLAFASIPPLFILAFLIYGASQQRAAHRFIQAQLAAMQADGQLLENQTQRFVRENRFAHIIDADWRELNEALAFLGDKYDVAFGLLDKSQKFIPASQPWPFEPIMEAYHRDAAPLIQRMQELLNSVKEQHGKEVDTLSQKAYGNLIWHTGETLENEFSYAFHRGDSARGAALLELEVNLAKSMLGTANAAPPFNIIHRSLEHDFWKAEDLQRVRRLLDYHVDVEKLWRQRFERDTASFLGDVEFIHERDVYRSGYGRGVLPFGYPSTLIASYLGLLSQLEQLPDAGTKKHVQATRKTYQRMYEQIAEMTLEGVTSIPSAFSRMYLGSSTERDATDYALEQANHRRVLTAVAIKQFQLQEGRWPTSLSELTKVGLVPADWKMVDDIDLGYRVDAGGKSARLWRSASRYDDSGESMFAKDTLVPTAPPSELRLDEVVVEAAETVIR